MLRSSYTEAHNNLGLVLIELDRSHEAIACFVRAIKLQPDSLIALKNLAFLLMKLDRYEEAISYFDRVLALEPNGVETYNNRGVSMQRLGLLQESVTSFEQALDRKPGYAVAVLNLGVSMQKLGQLDEAEAHLRRAVALEPANASALAVLGTILVEQQKIDEAVTVYHDAVALDPTNGFALQNLGLARRYRPDFDPEIAACRDSLLSQPGDMTVKVELASLLWQKGALDQAADLLDAVRADDGSDESTNYWLGLVHQSRNDPARARQCFERALALYPNDVHTEAALANLTAAETSQREPGGKRVALHINQRYHYRILKPVFDALRTEGHFCCFTPHVSELIAFRPDIVVVAEAQAPYLRDRLPQTLFVWVRHGLISKNTTMHAARIADFACLTSEASRDWYIQHGGRPRRDFWITGYPQMDIPCLSGLHPHPLGLEWAQTGYSGARHGCSRPRRSPIPAFATRVPATFPR